MKYTLLIIFLISTISVKLLGDTNDSPVVVAKWANDSITVEELEQYGVAFFQDDSIKAGQSDMDKRREIFQSLINNKMIRYIADSMKIDTVKTIREAYKRRLYRTAYNFNLYIDSVHKKIATDEMIRSEYELMKNKYQLSHILITDSQNNITNISDIYKMLIEDKADFSDTAEKYSQDQNTKEKGGYLGWNILNNFDNDFRNAVLSIKNSGEITKPFRTKYGWHIAKLHDIKNNTDLNSFRFEEKDIRIMILQKNKDKYEKISNDFENWLLNKYGVKTDSSAVRAFTEYFNSLYKKDPKKALDPSYYMTNKLISSFRNDSIFVKDLLKTIKSTYQFALDTKKNVPDITSEKIYDQIFYVNIFWIRPLIAEELGYTKKAKVLKAVKNGMISDYKDFFIKAYRGEIEQENEFLEPYYKSYDLVIDHTAFEKSFYFIPDDKK